MKARIFWLVGALLVATTGLVYAGAITPGGGSSGGGGGTIDGSGAATRVTFWSDADSLTSDADLTYDSATNTLTMVGPIGGAIQLRDSDNIIAIPNSDGTASQTITTNGVNGFYGPASGSGGAFRSTSTSAAIGAGAARTIGQAAVIFADGVTATASSALQTVYGTGIRAIDDNLTITIADNGGGTAATDSTTPDSELIYVACNDTNGCTWTPGTTSVPSHAVFWVANTGTALLTIADSGTDPTVQVGGLGHCVYNGTSYYCSGGAL